MSTTCGPSDREPLDRLAEATLIGLDHLGTVAPGTSCPPRSSARVAGSWQVRDVVGATPGHLRASVLGWSLAMCGLGLAFGLAASLAVSRYSEATFCGGSDADRLTMVAVIIVLNACFDLGIRTVLAEREEADCPKLSVVNTQSESHPLHTCAKGLRPFAANACDHRALALAAGARSCISSVSLYIGRLTTCSARS